MAFTKHAGSGSQSKSRDGFSILFNIQLSSVRKVQRQHFSSRCYKSTTVCVLKCRGGLLAKSDHSQDVPEEGAMTGLTVTDRETGKSVTIALSVLEDEIGRRKLNSGTVTSSQVNLDLITSDIYSQAYLDHLFSDKGPVAELENYFVNASERLAMHRTDLQRKNKTGARKAVEKSEDGHVLDDA